MISYWDNIAARTNGIYMASDFESAAYRIVCEQVIYSIDRSNRSVYSLVERYERDFKYVLDLLGINLEINREYRYIYAQPRHEKSLTISVSQTLFALTLRSIYDSKIKAGHIDDMGNAECDLIELDEKYKLVTQRPLPGKGELDLLLNTAKRWGIARKTDSLSASIKDHDRQVESSFAIQIRPAIVDVLGETALAKIMQWIGNNPDHSIENDNQDENADEQEITQ